MSEQQKRDGIQRRSWLLGCMGLIALCAGLAYAQWFFWGYVPLSTLPVVRYPKTLLREDNFCPDRLPPIALPYYSSDGEHYLDGEDSRYRQAGVVKLFRASDNQLLGTHSYRSVTIECWAQDGNGIYVTDYVPSSISAIGPGFPPSGVVSVKKLLIPCQSSLDSLSLFPRLYWGIRCALPGSEHGPFVVWFPLVVLLLGLGGMVMAIRKLWKKWINPWWHGSE